MPLLVDILCGMKHGTKRSTTDQEIERLEASFAEVLQTLKRTTADELTDEIWLEAAADLGVTMDAARLAAARIRRRRIGSARDAILAYLLKHLDQEVLSTAIAGVRESESGHDGQGNFVLRVDGPSRHVEPDTD